jgi:hypothetical protein
MHRTLLAVIALRTQWKKGPTRKFPAGTHLLISVSGIMRNLAKTFRHLIPSEPFPPTRTLSRNMKDIAIKYDIEKECARSNKR